MKIKRELCAGVAVVAVTLTLALAVPVSAQQAVPVSIGSTDVGGVVTGPRGPEAGVWVIAETTNLPTRMIKIVVTDDQGRYVIPELPQADYTVWARGYGLVDSAKIQTEPGKIVNLTAVRRRARRPRREYYPAKYWYSMLKIPDKSEFPGTGPNGNGMATTMKSQRQWLDLVKTDGCVYLPPTRQQGDAHDPARSAQFRTRPRPGSAASNRARPADHMIGDLGRLDTTRARNCSPTGPTGSPGGEMPVAKPQRPQGIERNVVITKWDWADPTAYLHDEISTDKRNPTVNANGKHLRRRPKKAANTCRCSIRCTTPRPRSRSRCAIRTRRLRAATRWQPSPYWGDEASGTARPARPQPDDRREGARLVDPARSRPAKSGLLQAGSTISRRRRSRSISRTAVWRCTIPRPAH